MGILQQARPDSSSLVSIQALRAIASLLVFWGHAINAVTSKVAAEFPHLYGPFGVDLFFVISGFVMVYSSERLFGQPGAPMTFFARRLARIVPLYWAATAILVWFVVPYASTKAVLGSLFFTPRIPSEAPLLFVGWTLIFEMFFYAVFAIALLAKRRFAVVAGATVVLICFSVVFAPDWAGPLYSTASFNWHRVPCRSDHHRICVRHDDRSRLSSGRPAPDVGHNQLDRYWFHLACGNPLLAPATIQRRHRSSIDRGRNVPVVDAQPEAFPPHSWRGVLGRHLLLALLHAPFIIWFRGLDRYEPRHESGRPRMDIYGRNAGDRSCHRHRDVFHV
jgi:hypothetical protein